MKKEITARTKLIGLIGSPIEHSISPSMQNEALAQAGLDYVYVAFNVGLETLEQTIEGFKAMNVRGWNITMPDKNRMCQLADKLSPVAQICGAVNTIVNDNGVLTGYTTDGIGYVEGIRASGYDIRSKVITLLGAGGAATAILAQAAYDGASEIHVFNRADEFYTHVEKTAEVLNQRTNCRITVHPLEDDSALRTSIQSSDILSNATNVGMAPDTDKCLIADPSYFHPGLIVTDAIYHPYETKLIQMAKEYGCPVVGGLYMQLFQGAASFELWTGRKMPVEIVNEKYFHLDIKL